MFNLGSNPTFREKFPPCAKNILCYFLMANLKQIWSASVCTCPWHIPSYHLHRLSWLWNPGAGPRLVLLCKWRSRISFLWKVKQAKKRLKVTLYNQRAFAYFPVDLDALISPWFPPWSSCFEAYCLRLIAEVLRFSGLNSLLWSIQFKNICRSFSWKS